MRRRAWFLGKAVLVIAVAALAAGLVMMLWNSVAVAMLSGVRPLDYPHAAGLLVLCRLLFGGFGGRGRGGGRGRWEKWQAMTAEEREALVQRESSCRGSRGAQ
jgi:hypothetical protein